MKKAINKLNLQDSTIEKAIEHVNPLRLVINEEFSNPQTKDYRKASIDRMFKAEVNFESENNTIGELFDKLNIQAICPKTGKVMKFKHTGGSGHSGTFVAKSGHIEVCLSIPYDVISVSFKSHKK